MRTLLAPLAFLAVLTVIGRPTPLAAQGLADLLTSIQQGGGWVAIPVKGGEGVLETPAVPTGGFTISGCMQVWPGHSGTWTIEARDPIGGGSLDVDTRGGQSVPFSYVTGPLARLQVDVRWSEPRDTTLLVWVGLDRPSAPDHDSCQPVYPDREPVERR
jgi:hypothetical protein